MPVGMIVMKWDDRVGTDVVVKYPEELYVQDKALLQVYSTHEYCGESGMISLMAGPLNITSYYTGPEMGFYILLLLNLDDDPDLYEGGLADIARIITQDIDNDVIDDTIANIFRRLSAYPTLNEEQQLYITYNDKVKRMIIERLRNEGVITKSEIKVWFKDIYKSGFVDIDGVIIDLVKRNLIKETSVKGISSELIFLTHDLLMLRIPPIKFLIDPEDNGMPSVLSNDYRREVKRFFHEYRESEDDNLKLIELLNDPEVYEVVRLLRTAIVTKSTLEKLKKKGVHDVDQVLRRLWEAKMIQVFQDWEQVEYYALISDFYLKMIFPTYLTRVIKKQYKQKSKSNVVLIEYLKILEDVYNSKDILEKQKKSIKKINNKKSLSK